MEKSDQEEYIIEYLKQYRKELSPVQRKRIIREEQASNPIYLRTILEELRVFGIFENLEKKIDYYLQAKTTEDLFDLMLERLETDYERERKGLVREVTTLIWASRRGLSEQEILEILGSEDQPMPRAYWSPLYLAMEESLVSRSGLLTFFHDFLKKAIEARYLQDSDQKQKAHLTIADYFNKKPINYRKAVELPWQLHEAGERQRLTACLVDVPLFLSICDRDQTELMHYWVWLKKERHMGQFYRESFKQWREDHANEPNIANTANQIALFLMDASLWADAEPLFRYALAVSEQRLGKDHPDIASILSGLGSLLLSDNRAIEAEPLLRRALVISDNSLGAEHESVSRDLNNLAQVLKGTERPAEAEALSRRALNIAEKKLGSNHPLFATALNNLAGLLFYSLNKMAEAETLYRRALAIDEAILGADHPAIARDLNNLAGLLCSDGRLGEAEKLQSRAISIAERNYGSDHPFLAIDLSNLSQLLIKMERLADAEPVVLRALDIAEKSLGPDHPNIGGILNNLGFLLYATNRIEEAEPILKRVVGIFMTFRHASGYSHLQFEDAVKNYVGLRQAMGNSEEEITAVLSDLMPEFVDDAPGKEAELLDNTRDRATELFRDRRFSEAEPLMKQAVAMAMERYGPNHPVVATALNDLGQLLQATGRFAEAETMMRRALTIDEQFLGTHHPCVARNLNNLANLLQATDRIDQAEPLIRRAFLILKSIFTVENPDTQRVLDNYTAILHLMGQSREQILARIHELASEFIGH